MVRWSRLNGLGLKQRGLLIGAAALAILLSVTVIANQLNLTWAEWTGFGADIEETRIEEVQPNGTVTKTTIAKKLQSQKTLWDWLSVLGVPFSLAILGCWLQQLQHKQAAESQRLQKEQASEEAKEEIRQAYFDRISTLLIDRNVIAIAIKVNKESKSKIEDPTSSHGWIYATAEEKELVNAAVDVIRARTLSILRRLGEDKERKGNVIRFLAETEIVSKLKLDLSGTDLSEVDLSFSNLSNANLTDVNLTDANLSRADLTGADLTSANLSGAILSFANLSGANLIFANLSNANLSNANLSNAKLSAADLSGTILIGANLGGAILIGASLIRADLSNADLIGAILISAKYNDLTKLPIDIDAIVLGMVQESPEPPTP